ncbi:LamG-like jellyroll fold domain-containing protein [Rugosimonospora acidiphila]|uniref:LamG-like jellyroll fold domain-containing protein n=1 Tax=Rugosimonospora acidiphila TaxID=556531 RepID=UPI0031E945BC
MKTRALPAAVTAVALAFVAAITVVATRASAAPVPVPDLLNVNFANGSAADTARNLTLTTVGSPAPTIAGDDAAGRQVATFDGSQNGYTYDLGAEWPSITDTISLECYFRFNGTLSGSTGTGSSGQSVCSDKQGGGFSVTVVGSSVEFQVAAASTSYTLATAPIAGGTWYDAVGTYDGSNVDLYLNGTLVAQTPATGAIHAPSASATHLTLGADSAAGTLGSIESFGAASVAQVGLYSTVLTADQISALYAANDVPTPTASPTPSPTGTGGTSTPPTLTPDVLDVDFASGAPVDHANNIAAKTMGAPTIATDPTLATGVATFDGSSDAYGFDLSPYWPSLQNAVTVECYFRYNGTLTPGSGSSGPSVCSDKNSGGYGFVLVGNEFSFQGYFNGAYTLAHTTLPAADTWYDAVGVYDGTNLTLYLNGVRVGQTAASGPIKLPGAAGRDFNLGADVSSTDGAENYIPSSVAAARIWSGPLSAAQVAALYAQNVSTEPVGSGDVLDVSFASGTPLDYAHGTPAKRIGSPAIAPDPKLGSDVASFNGTSDAYAFDLSGRWPALANSVAMQCVFKYNGEFTTKTSTGYLSGPSVCSDKNNGGYGFVIVGNKISFEADTAGGYTGPIVTLPSANTWYDAVGVYDGANITLYLNGLQVGQVAASGPITLPGSAGQSFTLGADTSATGGAENYIPASVEQAQIWGRPLSAGQVAQLDKTAFSSIPAADSQLQISAVYGGGGEPGSYFANDFVELLNASQTTSVSLGGLSLQYFAADGTPVPGATAALDDTTLAPGQYFLLAGHDTGQGDESDLSVAPDQTAPDLDLAQDGIVALVDGSGQEVDLPASDVIDSVSTGQATYSLGVPAPALTATEGDYRNDSGCTNTHNNGRDFAAQQAQTTPLFNTASPPNVCAATIPATFSQTTLSPSTGHGAAVATNGRGTLYVAETANSTVGSMTTGGGSAKTVAGAAGTGGSGDGGPATSAFLMYPAGVAVDDAGNVFVADTGNDVVREIRAADGTIVRYAGTGSGGYSGDGGPATAAELYDPQGLALDADGDLFIADSGNNVIREVTPSGTISTRAGKATFGYSGDGGKATSAQLASPYGVAVDSAGNLYIADSANNVVRRVDAAVGTISTVAGDHAAYVANNYVPSDSGDGGPAIHAQLNDPQGIAVDAAGNLYIADTANKAVRLVKPDDTISTMVKNPPIQPEGITVDNTTGDVFVADANSSHVNEIAGMPVPSTPGPGPAGGTLAFTAQPPSSVVQGQQFTVTLAAEVPGGHVDPAATGSVTLAPAGVPAGALACDGGLTHPLSAGQATYTCAMSQAADGVTLVASLSGYASATSAAFGVTRTVPSAPGDVSAKAGDHTVTVSWEAEDNVTGFEVFAGTTSHGEDLSKPACTAGPTATSCQVSGLRDGSAYWFEVVAVNGTVTSDPSMEVKATPTAPSAGIVVHASQSATKVGYGTKVTLTATVADARTRRPVRGAEVAVQDEVRGRWVTLKTLHTNGSGTVSYGFTATAAGRYRFTTAGEASNTLVVSVAVKPGKPVITGNVAAGVAVRVNTGNWEPSGLCFSYQWLADGKPIRGATGATFTPTKALKGQELSVRVTGATNGYIAASATSAQKKIK